MFGFGNARGSRRQVRNSTFGGSNMRNAALAGLGMLAWRWWRNRQTTGSSSGTRHQNFQERSYADSSSRSADVL